MSLVELQSPRMEQRYMWRTSDSNNVSVIDTATNNVTATVNVGSYPYGVAVNPGWNKGICGELWTATMSL